MPKTKNQAKNRGRFEVRGGVLNEFEFARNEGAMAEEEHNRLSEVEAPAPIATEGESVPVSPQEIEAQRIREVMETAHEKAQRNLKKRQRGTVSGVQKEAILEAAKKSAKKRASKKAAAKKSRGTTAKKSGARKGAAKKAAKKSSAKSSKGRAAGARSTSKGAGAKKGAARKGSTKKSGTASASTGASRAARKRR